MERYHQSCYTGRRRTNSMITFSICMSLLILALLAALISQQTSDWVLPANRDLYIPPFFMSEGFYRAFLINLSFASISTSASAIQFVKYSTFWMICDPMLSIFLNLGLGLFVAICLRSESSEIQSVKRWIWTFVLLIAGAFLFAFAAWTTVCLSQSSLGAVRQ